MSEIKKKTLIINYLPQSLTDEEYELIFSNLGPIKTCKIVRDHNSGYSYGFGFVEYVYESDAEKAIEQLNGMQLQNKVIKVAYSRQGEKIKGANLYIRNLPKMCMVSEVEALFAAYGKIIQCRLLTSPETGQSRGIGFVLFNTRDEAEAAMKALNGTKPPGFTSELQVSFAEDKNKAPSELQQKFLNCVDSVHHGHESSTVGLTDCNTPPVVSNLVHRVPRPLLTRPGRGGRARGRGGPFRNQVPSTRYNPIVSVGPHQAAVTTFPNTEVSDNGYIIYAYNIGSKTTQEELSELFSLYGTVSKVDVIWDFQNNIGKGYGFVTMPIYEEAAHAIQCLNGYNYAGKPLQVSFKTPKEYQ